DFHRTSWDWENLAVFLFKKLFSVNVNDALNEASRVDEMACCALRKCEQPAADIKSGRLTNRMRENFRVRTERGKFRCCTSMIEVDVSDDQIIDGTRRKLAFLQSLQ